MPSIFSCQRRFLRINLISICWAFFLYCWAQQPGTAAYFSICQTYRDYQFVKYFLGTLFGRIKSWISSGKQRTYADALQFPSCCGDEFFLASFLLSRCWNHIKQSLKKRKVNGEFPGQISDLLSINYFSCSKWRQFAFEKTVYR